MVEIEIRNLQARLNNLIDEGMELKELYDLSVKLDSLISRYYSEVKVRNMR